MYKQYLNDYEKRAEQIRKAARAVEGGGGVPFTGSLTKKESCNESNNRVDNHKSSFWGGFAKDDLLLIGLLFLLLTGDEKDMTMIIILGYLFLAGI